MKTHFLELAGLSLTLVSMSGAAGCGDSRSLADSGADSAMRADSGDAVDSGAPTDSGTDAAVETDAGADAAVALDGAVATTHYGVVSVGDVNMGGFVGRIQGAFVPTADLGLIVGGRTAIPAAPGCHEVLASLPVVPAYEDAGTLLFTGLILASHMMMQNVGGDYSFSYADLLETPGDPITLTVPGATVIESMAATVLTPDPATSGTWTLGSTGVWANWTAGNGDFVLLRFSTSAGERVCEIPDSGSFLIPAPALSPDVMPAGGTIEFQRVIESISTSTSGTQELRFRAFTQDQLVAL